MWSWIVSWVDELWFAKVFGGRKEPEEKEKLSGQSVQEWDRDFRKCEVTRSCFGMEVLTQGVGDGRTCLSGYGVVETDQVFFQEAGVVWWQSLGESPRWEALVCSQRREKAGKAKVDDGFRRVPTEHLGRSQATAWLCHGISQLLPAPCARRHF